MNRKNAKFQKKKEKKTPNSRRNKNCIYLHEWSIKTLKRILNKKRLAVNTWIDIFIQRPSLIKVHFTAHLFSKPSLPNEQKTKTNTLC